MAQEGLGHTLEHLLRYLTEQTFHLDSESTQVELIGLQMQEVYSVPHWQLECQHNQFAAEGETTGGDAVQTRHSMPCV